MLYLGVTGLKPAPADLRAGFAYFLQQEGAVEGITLFHDYERLAPGHFPGEGTFFCYCRKGELAFSYLSGEGRFSAGDVLILKNQKRNVAFTRVSGDFEMVAVFIGNPLIPRLGIGKYATDARRKATLFLNPVIRMSEERSREVERSFENLARRLAATKTFLYEESVSLAVSRLVLDISEGQLENYLAQTASNSNMEIFYRFIKLLEEGHYKEHRDVSWYAGQLCVSPKHLSYCANAAGGRSAQYWIDSLCINNLTIALRERPVREVCAEYHFSSLSYLSRYVKRLTGLSPREIR